MEINSTNKVHWRTILKIAGAFAAYHIGSGFASGAEILQFFGSWGGHWWLVNTITAIILLSIFISACFKIGTSGVLKAPNDFYKYVGGKYFSCLFDYFSLILIAGIGIAMFAGAGAVLNQYYGVPVQVGTIIMGIIATIIVLLGLKSVIDFLGIVGIFIIVFSAGIGLYTIATSELSLAESQANILTHVEDGKILQVGVLGFTHPFFAAVNYIGLMITNCCLFTVALSKQLTNSKDAIIGGIFSSIFYFVGAALIVLTVLYHLDFIAEFGVQVPTLAIIEKTLPFLSEVFIVILLLGILTTIAGYLWVISGRFAEDKTRKSKIIIIACSFAGVFLGSIIPFNLIINLFYPFAGIIGMIMFVLIIKKAFFSPNLI